MPHRAVPTLLSPLPTSMSELTEPERLIAGALRHWVAGLGGASPHTRSLVWNEMSRRLGAAEGRIALAALSRIVSALQEHARRRIRVHKPCCAFLGADELGLVALVAACQHGRWPLARARAEWLVESDGVGALLDAGAALGGVLASRGQRLPERAPRPAAGAVTVSDPGLLSVH